MFTVLTVQTKIIALRSFRWIKMLLNFYQIDLYQRYTVDVSLMKLFYQIIPITKHIKQGKNKSVRLVLT